MTQPIPSTMAAPIESERAVLGSILLDPELIDPISEIILPRDFSIAAHGAIFKAMRELYRSAGTLDLPLLANAVANHPGVQALGGYTYLASLETFCLATSAAHPHARLIRDASRRRAMVEAAREIMRVAQDEAFTVDEAAAKSLGIMADAVADPDASSGLRPLRDFAEEARAQVLAAVETCQRGGAVGWRTGLPVWDQLIGRIPSGGCYFVIAARPSNGKTAMALHLARHIAADGGNVGIFSLEMDGAQLAKRLASSVSGVFASTFETGAMRDIELAAAHKAFDVLGDLPIYVDQAAVNSPARMLSRVRNMERQTGKKLDAVFIDYLQITDGDRPHRERHREVALISKSFVAMKKELDVPLFVLCQLGRDAENSRPTLAQLRESGAIEQDADVVLALHRVRNCESNERETPTELMILKNRNGRIGMIDAMFDGYTQTFR